VLRDRIISRTGMAKRGNKTRNRAKIGWKGLYSPFGQWMKAGPPMEHFVAVRGICGQVGFAARNRRNSAGFREIEADFEQLMAMERTTSPTRLLHFG
jgi:hypothetical protein